MEEAPAAPAAPAVPEPSEEAAAEPAPAAVSKKASAFLKEPAAPAPAASAKAKAFLKDASDDDGDDAGSDGGGKAPIAGEPRGHLLQRHKREAKALKEQAKRLGKKGKVRGAGACRRGPRGPSPSWETWGRSGWDKYTSYMFF